ncbi:hypothetical protein SGO26_30005 (plasmid) [Cupriavidus metallidurans]|uniref:hypothetical protein n=1 Tax=Cupriavidus metallidurans TaxID=119219 RepID=UPI003D74D2EC
MNISSEIKDQAKYLESYVVLDTVTAAGKFAVGLGIGNVAREGLYLTPVGQAAYERLKELGKNSPQLVDVASKFKAKELVRQAFLKADAGGSIFFVCREGIYDTVYDLLNVIGSSTAAAA